MDRSYEVLLGSDAATVSDEAHEGAVASLGLIAQATVTTDEVVALIASSKAL